MFLFLQMSHIVISTKRSITSNKWNLSRLVDLHFSLPNLNSMAPACSGQSDTILAQLVKKSPNFMQPQGSLPFPQKPAFGHYNVNGPGISAHLVVVAISRLYRLHYNRIIILYVRKQFNGDVWNFGLQ
jgi:hypothetical protein